MTDTNNVTPPPDPAPADPPPEPAAADLADLLDEEPPEDQAVFDAGYVKKLRDEGARYRNERNEAREQLGRYEEVFGVYEDADRDAWLDLARSWAVDDKAAAQVFRNIANDVLGDGSDPGGDAAAQQSLEDSMSELGDADLTPDKVQSMIDDAMSAREKASAERQAVEDIYTEMRAAGVEPRSPIGNAVLWAAANQTEGDIAKAIKVVEDERQQWFDEKVTKIDPASRGGATTEGVVASAASPIQNLDDARKAADEYLKAQVGSSPGQ